MGATELNGKKLIEEEIVEKYCTLALCEKTYEKIKLEANGWENKLIPRLLNTIFHEIITEEMWHILKEFKNPTINFRTLQILINNKIKENLKKLF